MASSDKIQAEISEALGSETLQQKIASLGKTWQIILASIPIAIVLSLVFMLIMRFTAGIFVYLLFAVTIILLMALGIYLLLPQSS